MKIKLLLVMLIVSFTTFSQKTDNVNLNIILRPIQTITINPTQKNVNLIYDTKDRYSEGVSREYTDHIEVFSTGGFIIKINGNGNLININNNNNKSIPLSDVSITASNGTNVLTTPTYNTVKLSITEQTLISSGSGGRNLKYNVTYNNSLGAGDNYINKYFKLDGNESVYTTTLTYTIVSL